MKRIDLKKINVARSNTVRDINRRIILNYVRENAPISRSDIARRTALQRSTVSLIVQELKDLGLINEIYGESSGGRPPVLLTLKTLKPVAIGIAIMTDKTVIVTGDLSGRIIETIEFDTDPDFERTYQKVVEVSKELIESNDGSIEGIGINLPGVVDFKKGYVHFVPHFGWQEIDLAKHIERDLNLPVKVDNDANAVALAELWFGNLPEIEGSRDFITVLVKEGIGTGIVVDGQVHHGRNGTAGEFGHMTIGENAPVACATGSRKCWESFASDRSAIGRYMNMVSDEKAENITIDDLIDLALAGDEYAVEAIKQTSQYLGIGVANIIQALGPESIVLAGTMTRAWSLIEDELREAMKSSVCREYHSTNLINSDFGQDASSIGALSLFLASKFATITLT